MSRSSVGASLIARGEHGDRRQLRRGRRARPAYELVVAAASRQRRRGGPARRDLPVAGAGAVDRHLLEVEPVARSERPRPGERPSRRSRPTSCPRPGRGPGGTPAPPMPWPRGGGSGQDLDPEPREVLVVVGRRSRSRPSPTTMPSTVARKWSVGSPSQPWRSSPAHRLGQRVQPRLVDGHGPRRSP